MPLNRWEWAMPLTSKGEEIKKNMEKEYGKDKGTSVFYAAKNKGTISGVESKEDEEEAAGKETVEGNLKRLGRRYPGMKRK